MLAIRFPAVRCLCLFILLWANPGARGQERPDAFVLAVGIDKYQPPLNNLQGCVNDAIGMAKVYKGQEGKQFGKVESVVLTDAKGTHEAVTGGMNALETKGKAGDWFVLVLSGHGGITRDEWGFVAQDARNVTASAILGLADKLAAADKKVMILIDACHAGQLRFAASGLLNRYRDPAKGGIVIMVSSMPDELSTALGAYSAFARAAEEGLSGMADYDDDEAVTIKELRRFTYNRTIELCLKLRALPGMAVKYQDSAIDASLSFADSTVLVRARRPATPPAIDDGPDVASPHLPERTWKVMIPSKGTLPPITYQLTLDPFGHYRVTVLEGTRPVAVNAGAYKIKAKALHLFHHQGMDRVELVDVGPTQFQFRFGARTFSAKSDPRTAELLVDVAGRLAPSDPRDRMLKESPHKVHPVHLEGGKSYLIDLQSPEFDTYLRVEDAAGTHLAENDDGGEGRNSRLLFTAPRSGEYRVIVTSFDRNSGVYHLHVEKREGVRPPDGPPVKAEVVLNLASELKNTDPKDRMLTTSFAKEHRIELKAGVTYTIDMVSRDFDTFLRLEDADSKHIIGDDDSGGGLNARLVFTPKTTATYRIIATSYARGATGRYELTVRASRGGGG